jgi:hypothetical protein
MLEMHRYKLIHRDTGEPIVDDDGAPRYIVSEEAPESPKAATKPWVWVLDDPILQRRVRKGLIIDRIQASSKLDEAFVVLGGPGQYLYEKWQAAPPEVLVDDPEIIQLLGAMGLDPTMILAPES